MGRGKIEIKKIENANSRLITFSKRRAGLFKKAQELAILCDAEVSVIIFSHSGKLFEFSSSGINQILSRYDKSLGFAEAAITECNKEKQDSMEVDILKDEIEKLKMKQLKLQGKDLAGLSLKELMDTEQQLKESLLSVKKRQEQLLMQQIEQSRVQGQKTMLENETLYTQIEYLRGFLPLSERSASPSLEFMPVESTNSLVNHGVSSSEVANNCGDSYPTLHLGFPTDVYRKKKIPEREPITTPQGVKWASFNSYP